MFVSPTLQAWEETKLLVGNCLEETSCRNVVRRLRSEAAAAAPGGPGPGAPALRRRCSARSRGVRGPGAAAGAENTASGPVRWFSLCINIVAVEAGAFIRMYV